MQIQEPRRHAPISIGSFRELLAYEGEIIRRIHATPNGGRLLLIDPARLMEELNVELSDHALEGWRKTAGNELFDKASGENIYDAVRSSLPSEGPEINIHGLFRRTGS